MNVMNFMNYEEIAYTNGNFDYLIDAVGLMTVMSAEKITIKDGRTTRRIQFELVDERGKISCAVFGDYVDTILGSVGVVNDELPMVIIQFAKIKTYRGEVVVQNVMNTSRIIFNTDNAESIELKRRLIAQGVVVAGPIGIIRGGGNNVPNSEDFLVMYPRKNIMQLHICEEDGIFIVLGIVVSVLKTDQWYYQACKCLKAVTLDFGSFYCSDCDKKVDSTTPRFKLKLEVFDGYDTAAFMDKNKDVKEQLEVFEKLVGHEILFKVEKDADYAFRFDDSYKVKRICEDISIIDAFKNAKSPSTPKKMMFDASLPKLATGEPSQSKNQVPTEEAVVSLGDDEVDELHDSGANEYVRDVSEKGKDCATGKSEYSSDVVDHGKNVVSSIGDDECLRSCKKRLRFKKVKVEK